MLFFEYSFVFLFLPVTLIVDYLLPERFRNLWLFIASAIFYATSSWTFLPLLFAAIAGDYFFGRRVAFAGTDAARRRWVICSVVMNLALLGFFKYSGLVTSTLRDLGLSGVPLIAAALPVGISFYTFQSMSYPIDLYRRETKPARSLIDFGAFVTLFPQLIAGPIVRFRDIEDQMTGRKISFEKIAGGLQMFAFGLAKKLLIADTCAALCDPIFAAQTAPDLWSAWASMFFYAGQIYFDFSGYSDMAIGLGRMLGFEFPINFNSPYKATSFSDFWRRWHITLSTWLRDNLYIPLGGNRKTAARTYINLLLTMLLGGLWHGASWNFVIWGGYHGAMLAIERALGDRNPLLKLRPALQRAITFVLVVIGWVVFRIEELARAGDWLRAMAGLNGLGSPQLAELLALPVLLGLIFVPKNTNERPTTFTPQRLAFTIACFVLALVIGYGRGSSPFLYFRF